MNKINKIKNSIKKSSFKINFKNIKINEKKINKIFENNKTVVVGVIALGIVLTGHTFNNINNTNNVHNPFLENKYDGYRKSGNISLNANENILDKSNINKIDNKNDILNDSFFGLKEVNKISKTKKGNIPFYDTGIKNLDGKNVIIFPDFGNNGGKKLSNDRILSLGIGKYHKNDIDIIHTDILEIFLRILSDNSLNSYQNKEINFIRKEIKQNNFIEKEYKNGLEFITIHEDKLNNEIKSNYLLLFKEMEKQSSGLIKIKY